MLPDENMRPEKGFDCGYNFFKQAEDLFTRELLLYLFVILTAQT
jgi:hypothetical protein